MPVTRVSLDPDQSQLDVELVAEQRMEEGTQSAADFELEMTRNPSTKAKPAADDLVPVTPALLAFIAMLQHAKDMFSAQSNLAMEMKSPTLHADPMERCQALYYDDYATQATALGLDLTKVCFETIMAVKLADDPIANTDAAILQKVFGFSPWHGICRIDANVVNCLEQLAKAFGRKEAQKLEKRYLRGEIHETEVVAAARSITHGLMA